MKNFQISKAGIFIKGFCFSWIIVAGLLVSIVGIIWVNIVLPNTNTDQESDNTDEASIQKDDSETKNPADTNSDSTSPTKKKNSNSPPSSDKNTGDSSNGSTTSSMTLVALGNSITTCNSPSSTMIGDNKSYSYSTGSDIGSLYMHIKNSGITISPINLAVGGAKSADVLSSQVPQIAGYNPETITLLVGGNDMLSLLSGQPVTIEQFQNNLSSIAGQIKSSNRRVLIGTIPNYGTMWQAGYSSCSNYSFEPAVVSWAVSQYNSVISSVANANGFTLVDLYPYLGTGDVSDYDCLHPNLSGQQKIANRFIANY